MTPNVTSRRHQQYNLRVIQYRLLVLLFISTGLTTTATDEWIKEIRPDRDQGVERFDEVYAIVLNTFIIACAPVVILFLSSLFRDPKLPRILRAAWSSAMRKMMFGNLSCGGGGGSSRSSRMDI